MKWLTKSDYMKFLIHPAYFWLAKHAKDQLPPFDEIAQANVDQGNAVEAVAQKLFPGAHLVDVPLFDGPEETARLVAPGGPDILLQAAFLTPRKHYVRSDVIIRQPNGWDVYEIKGSASVKPAHILDLAFQKQVLETEGLAVQRLFVVHINPLYVRRDGINPAELFIITEVTDQVAPLETSTHQKIEDAAVVLAQSAQPSDAPELAADWYGYRDIYAHLHPDLPLTSIYKLTRLKLAQIQALAALHISDIRDIPDNFELGPQQIAQVALAKSGRPRTDIPAIARDLAGLAYPLYFLDYETFASALPLWDGVRPYQQLPFQYSLHILREPGGQLEHKEFLARGGDYPIPELLKHLQTDLGPGGRVVVWNKSFEMGCNADMATLHPEYAAFLEDVNSRVYDLMEIFSNGYYGHPGFQGSASIKKVLPVLVPELSYKNLGIGEGLTAQVRWMKAARGELSAEAAAGVYADLVTYCGQDTMAMVRIFEVLQKVIKTA